MESASRFDDSISLMELWSLLVRRRWWVIAMVLVCLLAGLAYIMAKNKVYASTVDIVIAATVSAEDPNIELFVTPPRVLARILDAKESIVGGGVVAWVSGADFEKSDRRNNDLLRLEVRGYSTEHTHRFAEKLATDLVAHQNAFIDLRRKQLLSYRKGLEADLMSTQRLLQRLARKQRPDFLRAQAQLIQTSADLQSKIAAADQQASPAYLRDAQIVSGPTAGRAPVEPRTKVVLIGAVLGGLLLGFLLVVLVEFFTPSRKDIS